MLEKKLEDKEFDLLTMLHEKTIGNNGDTFNPKIYDIFKARVNKKYKQGYNVDIFLHYVELYSKMRKQIKPKRL